MAAWNGGFPATYQPMGFPQYQPMYQQQQQPQASGRMVEIVPVDSEEAAASWPVGVGQTQAMIAKNDAFIAFKTVQVNGQSEFIIYDKRPPAPPAPAFDPKQYVRRDEVEKLVESFLAARKGESGE